MVELFLQRRFREHIKGESGYIYLSGTYFQNHRGEKQKTTVCRSKVPKVQEIRSGGWRII